MMFHIIHKIAHNGYLLCIAMCPLSLPLHMLFLTDFQDILAWHSYIILDVPVATKLSYQIQMILDPEVKS